MNFRAFIKIKKSPYLDQTKELEKRESQVKHEHDYSKLNEIYIFSKTLNKTFEDTLVNLKNSAYV
jgi:hypothetical protein